MSRNFPLRDQLAAALAIIAGIPYADRKKLHRDQIISLFNFDHDPVPYTHDGPSVHYNCTPRLRADHLEKTRKKDVPMLAKVKRVRADNAQHLNVMLGKTYAKIFEDLFAEFTPRPKPKRKIPSRPFPKSQRKMQSRNTLRRKP